MASTERVQERCVCGCLIDAESALLDLVRLKDGVRDSVYLREKPKAWARARRVLGLPDPGGFD